jgi:hypothetical protein
MQIAVGMSLTQALSWWMNDGSNDKEARERIFCYFGDFGRTMMTMFEITMANWVITCRQLMDDVNRWWGLFYVVYQCMICFSALKVISAVFIAQTNRAVARDDDLVTMVEEENRKLVSIKLQHMFESLDDSHDGYLTWKEFEHITEDKLWRSWGAKLGIPMSDLTDLFNLLAGEDGRVSAKEFFNGIQRVKGPAKGLDMIWLLKELGVSKQERPGTVSQTQTPLCGTPAGWSPAMQEKCPAAVKSCVEGAHGNKAEQPLH